MKKFLFFIACTLISFSTLNLNAQTDFKIFSGLDTYYATDDASIPYGHERTYTINNIYKDKFSSNDAIIGVGAKSNFWKANVAVDFQDHNFALSQANVSLKLCGNLWIEGGHFFTNAPGELDNYSWDNYFTSYSIASQLAPNAETGFGLAYDFTPETHLSVRVINSGWANDFRDNNSSKSVSARLDVENIIPKWNLSVGTVCGNENKVAVSKDLTTFTAVDFRGNFTKCFEGAFTGQFGTVENAYLENGEEQLGIMYGITAQARYHFSPKFNAAARVSYCDNQDGGFFTYRKLSGLEAGVNLEYKPTSFAFLRLEAGYLAMSSENENLSKVFYNNNDHEYTNTRMQLALSAGVYFDAYRTLGGLRPTLNDHHVKPMNIN
ncbi:MAG: outer membrane beta-barrel protein [Bacteroidetes bacterium]|nr:outer membrane beta-barrel protein [Bacteroidota bacterium]MBR3091140.1 outer membrane beta-barrel protein [Bacteroidota bacterium]